MLSGSGRQILALSGVAHVIVDDITTVELAEEDQHHLGTVRRLRSGDPITLGDGRGGWRTAVLRLGDKGRGRKPLDLEFTSEVFSEAREEPPIVIGFCLPSLDRASWALQKMTELGVDRVCLLHSQFSSTRQAGLEEGGRELARLQKVVKEAGMQSRAAFLPILEPLMSLESFAAIYPTSGVCTLGGDSMLELGITVVVGPEGGFTRSELALFSRKIDLGRNILRSETAAVVVSGVLSLQRAGLLG